MKKTLLITLDFLPNRGGISNYYYNIYKNLPQDKIIILTNVGGENSQNIIRKNLNFNLSGFFKTLKEIKKIVKNEKVEEIWVGNILPIGKYAYILKKILKINYSVFIHGLDIKLAQNKINKKFFTKIILDNAKNIFVNSESTKSIINTKTNIEIIYPGIDENFTNINPDKKLEIIKKYNLEDICLPVGKKKIILTVGRVIKRKNHELVIKAIHGLKKQFENLIYIISGTGDNLEYLKKIADNNTNIIFLDNVSDEELPYFYSICDMFIMVSNETKNDTEGFGIVYLEAGIFKKPSIASNSGGAKEAVIDNKTGILIKQNDEDELANAIKYLIENPELSKNLGENAYKRIMEQFLWKDIVNNLIKNG